MSLIEGIGDEVMVLAALLVVATTLIAAWLSTHVGDRPGPHQVVIQTTITTIQGRQQQQTTENAPEATGDQTRVPDGGGNSDGSTNVHESASSDSNQETSPDRTSSANDSQTDPSAVSSDSLLGAESEAHHRTSNELSSATQTSRDEVDSNTVKSDEKSEDATSKRQNSVEVLGQTTEDSHSNEDGNSTTVEGQRSSGSLNENILRNRQTGQIYPTLPSYSSEATEGAVSAAASPASSGGVAEEPSGVEDVGGVEGDGQTQEGSIRIRVKFSNDQERFVQTFPEETLGQFRR